MKTLAFSPAVYNLAETTRALEIAKACHDLFDILFVSYGGEFENLIEQEGFAIRRLKPQLIPEKIEYLYKVDQGHPKHLDDANPQAYAVCRQRTGAFWPRRQG